MKKCRWEVALTGFSDKPEFKIGSCVFVEAPKAGEAEDRSLLLKERRLSLRYLHEERSGLVELGRNVGDDSRRGVNGRSVERLQMKLYVPIRPFALLPPRNDRRTERRPRTARKLGVAASTRPWLKPACWPARSEAAGRARTAHRSIPCIPCTELRLEVTSRGHNLEEVPCS